MIELLKFGHVIVSICAARMKFNSKSLLLIIIVVSLVIRVGYVLTLEDKFFFPDSSRYDGIASELMLGKGFSSASTAPLYPVFLSWVYALFGHSFLAVRIVHSVIGSASIFIIYLIARDVFSEKVGLIAGLLGAIYPFFIFFTGLILTETLFIFLLLCLILFLRKVTVQILSGSGTSPTTKRKLVLFLRKMTFNMRWDYTIFHMKWGYAVCTGILAGLSILIKPIMAYFLLFAFIIILAICNDRRKMLLANGLLIFLITGFVVAPWGWDNYKRSGKFIFLTTGGGLTLYESNNPRADGGPGGEKIVWTEEMKSMNEIELDRYFKQEAVIFIKNNPCRFVELAVIKFRRFWSFTPNAGGYQSWKYKLISIISYGPVVLLAVWQIIATRKRWRELVFLYLPIVFFTLLHTVMLGSLRYRMPIMLYVIIFAANGVSKFLSPKQTSPARIIHATMK